MDTSQQAWDKDNRNTVRRAYTKPHVQIYGDLGEITQSVGMSGKQDNPPTGAMNDKTS